MAKQGSKKEEVKQEQPKQKQVSFEELTVEQQIQALENEKANAQQRATYMQGRIDQLKSTQNKQKERPEEK
jgi:hypothetical protein